MATLIPPDGQPQIVQLTELNDKTALEAAQSLVGSNLAHVIFEAARTVLYYNPNGLEDGLPVNKMATSLARSKITDKFDYVRGNALLLSFEEDGRTVEQEVLERVV